MSIRKNGAQGNSLFVILTISFAHLCHDIYSSFLAPILPLLIEKLALSFTSAGFISVLLRLPSVLSPLIGALADRVNLKHMVIISPAATAAAMCLMGSAPDYTSLALLAVAAGISAACFHVPAPVVLRKLTARRVGAAMSAFQIGGELSRTLGPIVVLGAVSLWALNGLYRLIPLGVLVSFFLYWALRDVPSSATSSVRHHIGGSIFKTFARQRMLFISIAGILLCKCFSASVIGAYLPTYLTVKGESLWFAGGALSLVQAFAIIGVFITGTLSDRIGCKKTLVGLTLAAPLAMLLCIYSSGWLFIVSLAIVGLSAFSSTPVLLALIQKSDFEFPAIANGIYMTCNFMLSSLAVLLAGKLSDATGIIQTFTCCALFSWAGVPFALLLKKKYDI